MSDFTKTVAAISTPPGKGGVAVIRMSGADALKIADRCFVPRRGGRLSDFGRARAVYGDVVASGERIDDAIALYFSAPSSFTGEDTVEISCHGGILVTQAVLTALFSAGASPAEAGEFTRRAFINGKISLTEAEAIGDLLDAGSMAQVRLSSVKSRSRLSDRIEKIRAEMLTLMSSIFARIDYPDEDLAELTDREITDTLGSIITSLDSLIETYKTGRAVNEGIKTVICGSPNAGKSSLYNLLVGEDRAIVTEHAGTTRDVLTERISLGTATLLLTDTAGLRITDDPVEKIGVERSREQIDGAELVIAVFDGSRPMTEDDSELIERLAEMGKTTVAIINKEDLTLFPDTVMTVKSRFENTVEMSAISDSADKLRSLIESLFIDEKIRIGTDAVVSNARQHASLIKAKEHAELALNAFCMGFPCDVASSDLELAIGAISELDGRAVSESVVGEIFARFCVGK